jgi:hypothetical protein
VGHPTVRSTEIDVAGRLRLWVFETRIERDSRTEWSSSFGAERDLGPHCRRAYLIEITPQRIVDDYCPAVGEGLDRMANIAWHDPHHPRSGDLCHSVDG